MALGVRDVVPTIAAGALRASAEVGGSTRLRLAINDGSKRSLAECWRGAHGLHEIRKHDCQMDGRGGRKVDMNQLTPR